MPDKRCANGHFIDESWDICPYCPPEKQGEIPVVRPSRQAAVRELPVRSKVTYEPLPAAPAVDRTSAAVKVDAALLEKNRLVVGWLVGINGAARGDSFEVRSGRNIIGRDPKSDIRVDDDQASAHHADLVYRSEENRFILMDHNSTNGTFVNDQEIEPRRDLRRGDIVRIGGQKLMFVDLVGAGFSWEEQDDLT